MLLYTSATKSSDGSDRVKQEVLNAMDCCAIDDTNDRRCPDCGTTGRLVGVAPIRPHVPDAVAGPWSYCPNASCRIVYFLEVNAIDDDHVFSQVGTKAATKPKPVCFCFGHTAADIAADLALHGRSTINESVNAAIANGLCARERLNPTGKCCLPAIRRALRPAERVSR